MFKRILNSTRYTIFKNISSYILDVKKSIAKISLLKIYFFILATISPLLYKWFVNSVLMDKKYNLFIVILIGYIVIYLLEGIGNILSTYINNKVFILFAVKLRVKLFRNTFFMRFSDFKKYSVGDLKNRIDNDVDKLQGFVTGQCIDFIYLIASSIVLMVIMLFQNWILALFSFTMIPLSYITRNVLSKKIAKLSELYRKEWGEYESTLNSTFQNWKDMRTNNLQQNESKRFEKIWESLNSLFIKTQIFLFINRTFISFQKMFLIKMNLYFLGGILVINNKLSVGTLLAFMIYYEWFYGNINDLNNMSVSLKSDMPLISRVLELLNMDLKVDNNQLPSNGDENYIDFENVSFTYGKTDFAIKNINIKLERGQYIALAGRSGSGKTTLSQLLLNLYPLNSGEIKIAGIPVDKYSPLIYHKMISAVSQDPTMFNMSIRDNLLLVRYSATDFEIIEACKDADIYDLISSLPQGLDTIIGERGVKLSGGEKQRLAVARILLLNPDIIIFDEATSSLDYENEMKVTEAISYLSRSKTIIVIAHRLSSLISAEKVVLLDDGETVGMGTHEELRHNNKVYNELFKRQYEVNK